MLTRPVVEVAMVSKHGTHRSKNIQRVMVNESLKVALTIIMKNHVYNFNNEMRKQNEGGAIGMDLTGTIANIFMTWWDKELLKKLNALGI